MNLFSRYLDTLRILNELNPSQRESLAGLDDTTADGLNGFKSLENVIINFLGRKQTLLTRLECSKRYLKIVYPQNCMEHSDCPSHCISLALSDPKDPNLAKNRHCSDGHQSTCDNCSKLCQLIDEVTDAVNGLVNSDILYDVKIAKENIFKWQQHIIRHVQQNKAKVKAMDLINKCTGLWIRDYYQKVLLMQFREGQCSYFGKKGMTLHTNVFLLESTTSDNKQ